MDVAAWLRGLGLEQHAQLFCDNDIDGEILCGMTAEDLKELGISSFGHRRRLLNAITALGGEPADSRMRVSILLFRFITRQQCQCSFSEHHYVDGPISTIYFDNESLIQRFDIRKTGHSERHTQRYLHPLVRHSVNIK